MALGSYNAWLQYVAPQPTATNSAYARQAALYFGANDTGLVTMFTFGAGFPGAVPIGAGAQFRFTPQPRIGLGVNHF